MVSGLLGSAFLWLHAIRVQVSRGFERGRRATCRVRTGWRGLRGEQTRRTPPAAVAGWPPDTSPNVLRAWYSGVTRFCDPESPHLSPKLHAAAALAVANELATRGLGGQPDWRDEARNKQLAAIGLDQENATLDLISLLATLDRIHDQGYSRSPDDITENEQRYWEERVDKYLDQPSASKLGDMVAWLLAWKADSANTFVAVAAQEYDFILKGVEECGRQSLGGDRFKRIAQGLVTRIRDGDDSQLVAGSDWLRDRRHYGRPQSMRAPSGRGSDRRTWRH